MSATRQRITKPSALVLSDATEPCAGRVYKIRCTLEGQEELFYIGGSVRPLAQVLPRYRAASKKSTNTSLLYTTMRELGEENFSIELVEAVPFDGPGISERAEHWRKALDAPLNKNRLYRTLEEKFPLRQGMRTDRLPPTTRK